MNLLTWPIEEESLTIDSNSLIAFTYFRLNGHGALLHSSEIANPSFGSFTKIPMLSQGNHSISNVDEILMYFRKENYGLEYELSDMERVHLKLFVDLIELKILPALNWFMWYEHEVYPHTFLFYKEALNSFFSRLDIMRWRNVVLSRCRTSSLDMCITDEELKDSTVQSKLHDQCKLALTSLSHVLADKKYFVSDRPTAVDAYIFGRLVPFLLLHWKISQVKGDTQDYNAHPLVQHLYGCENIIRHCLRIQELCYPKAKHSFKTTLSYTHLPVKLSWKDRLFSKENINVCIFGLFASSIFLLYAKNIGLIQFGLVDAKQVNKSSSPRRPEDDHSLKHSNPPIVSVKSLVEEAKL